MVCFNNTKSVYMLICPRDHMHGNMWAVGHLQVEEHNTESSLRAYSCAQNHSTPCSHYISMGVGGLNHFENFGPIGESREVSDSGRIWTVGLQHEWLMSLQKCHLKGISFNKLFLSTIFVEVLFHCLRCSYILFDFGPSE